MTNYMGELLGFNLSSAFSYFSGIVIIGSYMYMGYLVSKACKLDGDNELIFGEEIFIHIVGLSLVIIFCLLTYFTFIK